MSRRNREEFSNAVRDEAWHRCGGLCEGILPTGERCNFPLKGKPKHYDHRIMWAISRDSTIGNCQVLCVPCHDRKTAKQDLPLIAKVKRIARREAGIRPPKSRLKGRPFPKAEAQRSASRPLERKTP